MYIFGGMSISNQSLFLFQLSFGTLAISSKEARETKQKPEHIKIQPAHSLAATQSKRKRFGIHIWREWGVEEGNQMDMSGIS